METEIGFGRVLVEQRKKRGMSRSQLAQEAELSYPYVSQLETGLRKPSRKAASRLADALGIDARDLEAAIPADGNPKEIERANQFSDQLLADLGSPQVTGAPPRAVRRRTTRDDLVGQMVDLLEEFGPDERLDALAEVQKLAMRRMLDAGRGAADV